LIDTVVEKIEALREPLGLLDRHGSWV